MLHGGDIRYQEWFLVEELSSNKDILSKLNAECPGFRARSERELSLEEVSVVRSEK